MSALSTSQSTFPSNASTRTYSSIGRSKSSSSRTILRSSKTNTRWTRWRSVSAAFATSFHANRALSSESISANFPSFARLKSWQKRLLSARVLRIELIYYLFAILCSCSKLWRRSATESAISAWKPSITTWKHIGTTWSTTNASTFAPNRKLIDLILAQHSELIKCTGQSITL